MGKEDNCIECGTSFGESAFRSVENQNTCTACMKGSPAAKRSIQHIDAGGESKLITGIGWIGIVVSLIGTFVALSEGTQALWIPVLVLFEMSVMILGFGILVGNSDKLVGYAKQMATKES